jgi:hypothetical protein
MKRYSRLSLYLATILAILGLLLLPRLTAIAQVYPQIIPRIETISSEQEDALPSYRLVISRPQDLLFVYCPENHAPKLGYVRNVEAIQCEPI